MYVKLTILIQVYMRFVPFKAANFEPQQFTETGLHDRDIPASPNAYLLQPEVRNTDTQRTTQTAPPITSAVHSPMSAIQGASRLPNDLSRDVGAESHHKISALGIDNGSPLAMLSQAANRAITNTVDNPAISLQPRAMEICQQCTQLKLAPDKFVVEEQQTRRRQPMLHKAAYQDAQFLTPTRKIEICHEKVDLGNMAHIKDKAKTCPFCRLVWRAAQDQFLPGQVAKLASIKAYANWQLDGREIFTGKPRTRRVRLQWSEQTSQYPLDPQVLLSDAFVVLMAEGYPLRDHRFLGLPLNIDRNITALATDWVWQCQDYHHHENEITPPDTFARQIDERRFMLLNVREMKTCFPTHAEQRYVALSWAAAKVKENVPPDITEAEQYREGAWVDESKQPRAIQDAILLVRALRVDYLWVHPICTIANAAARTTKGRKYPRDRNHHIMDQIFGNSVLTICAADVPDEGLVALHTPRAPVIQHTAMCGPGLQLMVSHPAHTYLQRSAWFKRAWTFQEHFLSKRCLIFSAGRMWFQCRDAATSEDIAGDIRESYWNIDMLHTPAQTFGNFQDLSQAIRAYTQCVESYTMRDLTWQDDILVAFEGFSKMLETSLETNLLYGLPSCFLDMALLWEFKGEPARKPGAYVGKMRQTTAIRKFPSWSWCGWEGSMTYRPSTLYGVQSDVPAWLSSHTWISWYVRDRYNFPHPLHKFGEEGGDTEEVEELKSDLKHERGSVSIVSKRTKPPVKWPSLNRKEFYKSVPSFKPDIMEIDNELPEDPKVRDTEYLQFWTWSGYFRLSMQRLSNSSNLGPGLSRFEILDNKDDFCGTIVLPDRWHDKQANASGSDSIFEFIAISEAKDFAPDEFDGWTYYVPKERDQREWDLWYVLLVEKVDDVVVKRAGLGKIFQEAFQNSYAPGKEWKEFIMA